MAIRKDTNGRPVISQVQPEAAITGGELYIRGKSLATSDRPHVTIGDVSAPVVIGSSSLVIVKVPEGASAGELIVENGAQHQRCVDLRHRHPDRGKSAPGDQPGGGFDR